MAYEKTLFHRKLPLLRLIGYIGIVKLRETAESHEYKP